MGSVRSGLMGSTKQLLASALALVQVRVALFANDLEISAQRLFDALALAMLAWLGVGIGTVLLCALVLMLVQDAYRIPVLLVMALGFLGAGIWGLLAARRSLHRSRQAFEATRSELSRDLAALQPDEPR